MRAGDNLSRIAYRLGTTVVELKRDNALKSDVIGIGKRLKIEKPFQVPRQESRDWQRPLARRGEILREFGPYKNEQGVLIPRTGVDVQTTVGSKVQAPHHGVIRYIGEQDGFGTLMIIEHGQRVSTVLAPLDASSLMWKVGEVVWRGDVLGKTAAPVEGELPYLHLELRRNDKAVSPAPLLE